VWNSLPLGLVLTDAEGRVQFINSFFASLTGFGSSQNLPRFEQMACWPEPEAIPADTEPDTASAGTVEDRNHASGSGKTAITTVHGQQIEVGITLLPIQSVYQSELRLYFIVPETLGDPQEVVSWLEGMQRVNEGVRLRLEDLQKERGLTLREMQVIEQVMEGLQNKEIADQLHVAEITVKKHLTRIFGKCGVQSRFELARFVNRFSIESGMGRPRGGQGGRHEEYTE
jgi:DNA-binding CsgD family transcriptional regulator